MIAGFLSGRRETMKYDIYEASNAYQAAEGYGERVNDRAVSKSDLRSWLNANYGDGDAAGSLISGNIVQVEADRYLSLEEAMNY
jgi:hypothetical protein